MARKGYNPALQRLDSLLDESSFSPAFLVTREKIRSDLQVLEHPPAINAHVLIPITRREPNCLRTTFARIPNRGPARRLQQVPFTGRAVAVDHDYRIHDMMDREGEDLGRVTEKGSDIFPTLSFAEISAIPARILGKKAGDGIRVIIVVACG